MRTRAIVAAGILAAIAAAAGGGCGRSQLEEARILADEMAAIATLRALTSAQAAIQNMGKIDADRDGFGEYGTFLEMTASAGLRQGYSPPAGPSKPGAGDFSKTGPRVNPSILSFSLASVDADGVVTKSGYCHRIFLPDSAPRAGWVHETGPAERVGLVGGTGKVGVDLSENWWCAYAWPVERGRTGERAFFVNQAGDVLQCANGNARYSGKTKMPQGSAAFRGAGITSQVAVGTTGNDGEFWKRIN